MKLFGCIFGHSWRGEQGSYYSYFEPDRNIVCVECGRVHLGAERLQLRLSQLADAKRALSAKTGGVSNEDGALTLAEGRHG